MGIIIWLIVGGICGWLASLIMRTDAQQGIMLNIVVGIVGAVIAGLILGANINDGDHRRNRFLYVAARRGHPSGDRQSRPPRHASAKRRSDYEKEAAGTIRAALFFAY